MAGGITVDAGPTGTVNASGAKLNAVSTAGKGGCVTLTGRNVGLLNGTRVNASGTNGGGTVLAGGGAHGADANVANAQVTVLDATSSIDASATQNGNGGTVVLWSQSYTGFYGNIAANGGPQGGNGGWVETSSLNDLQVFGNVRAAAVLGNGGNWLLDPTDVTIGTTTANASDSGGVWTVHNATATINASAIAADLNDGVNVTITTNSSAGRDGNITITSDIAKTGGSNASLTLIAGGRLTDQGVNISATSGALNVTMTANSTVTLADGSSFFLNGGTLAINGGNATNTLLGVNIGQTTVNASAATIIGSGGTNGVFLGGLLNASGTPSLTINGTSNASSGGYYGVALAGNATVANLTVNGVGNLSTTGNVGGTTFNSTLNATGDVILNGQSNGSTAAVFFTGNIASADNVTVTGVGNARYGVNISGAVNASAP